MSEPAVIPPHIEIFREPISWDNLEHEPRAITNQKKSRAIELGVVAVLFTGRQVSDRIRELAQLEHALSNGSVDDTVYSIMLMGGGPFAVPFLTEMASLAPTMSPIVDCVDAGRYADSQLGGNVLDIKRKFRSTTNIFGKRLKALEDTIDEGVTMDLFGEASLDEELCHQLGDGITGPAESVGVITLSDKRIAELKNFKPSNILRGFWIPNAWAGGRGLDGANEALRWAPELVITSVQHEKYYDDMPEILDTLGERAVMGMNDITWIQQETA